MATRLVINGNPEVLIKDIVTGYLKGNHTLLEMVAMMDTVLNSAKMKVEE